MRVLLAILLLALVSPALVAPTRAAICTPDVGAGACVGSYTFSTDCRVGAVRVNGAVVWTAATGAIAAGEFFWQICQPGFTAHGHSIEVLALAWYDYTWNGARTCELSFALSSVPTDCALGPPVLPTLP